MNRKQEYIEWCKDKVDQLPLFLRPWWLDAVCLDQWDMALYHNKEGKIKAALPYFTYKKFILDIIGMPFLTPYMGIYIEFPKNQKQTSAYDFEKEIATELISQIPGSHYAQQKFFADYWYGLPFFWKGYRLDWRYTYHLSLHQSEEAIWENLEGSARTQLLKTNKLIRVEISDDYKTLYELVGMTFAKQNKKVPYTLIEFERLFKIASEKKACAIYLARLLENNKAVAGMFMAKDHSKVYNLVLGRDHHSDPGGSIHGILYRCIQDHLGHQEIFDFEGSMLEGPERMFRSFGSTRIPILQVTRYKNRWWKAALALAGK